MNSFLIKKQHGESLLAAMLAVTLLLTSATVAAATKEEAEAACDAADAARKQAAGVGMEWRDTRKMIKSAKQAIESGDYETASQQCAKAKYQGEAGVKQAEIEKSTWMSRVPK